MCVAKMIFALWSMRYCNVGIILLNLKQFSTCIFFIGILRSTLKNTLLLTISKSFMDWIFIVMSLAPFYIFFKIFYSSSGIN